MEQKHMIMLAVALVAVYFLFLRDTKCGNDKDLTTECARSILLDNMDRINHAYGKRKKLTEDQIKAQTEQIKILIQKDDMLQKLIKEIGNKTNVIIVKVKDLKDAIKEFIKIQEKEGFYYRQTETETDSEIVFFP